MALAAVEYLDPGGGALGSLDQDSPFSPFATAELISCQKTHTR